VGLLVSERGEHQGDQTEDSDKAQEYRSEEWNAPCEGSDPGLSLSPQQNRTDTRHDRFHSDEGYPVR